MKPHSQASTGPDFVAIKRKFDKSLGPGERADIRRARLPEDLGMVPATYRLLPAGQRPTPQWLRFVYFLPYARQAEPNSQAESLGVQLSKKRVSEARLFQLVRSEAPTDLQHLRRLLIQTEPVLDWSVFGNTLYFWGERQKRRIVEDYFVAGQSK